MTHFSLALPPRIAFGRTCSDAAPDACLVLGQRVLMLRSPSVSAAGRIYRALEEKGAELVAEDHRGEPTIHALRAALDRWRKAPPDVILAIGGGSVIDMGKALAALLPQPGPTEDHLEIVGAGRPLDAPPLPVIAVPTTAGTGAEATKNSVIGVPEAGRKVSLRDAGMIPARAFVDPALTDESPRNVTLASGLDAITQVIEPYLSARANLVTDALCRDAISRGIDALHWLMAEESAEARDTMAYVSLIGGIALTNAGLGAVHGLAGVVGGQTGLAHGAICGRLLVPVLRANEEALAVDRDTARIDFVARILADQFGVPKMGAFDAFQDWIDDQGLPYIPRPENSETVLGSWAEAAADASSMKANPVPLPRERLAAILSEASA